MIEICPVYEKCPIFSGVLKGKNFTTSSYKKQYCEAGLDARNNCKRWLCRNKFGKAPDYLLPNSDKTLDEIGKENNWL